MKNLSGIAISFLVVLFLSPTAIHAEQYGEAMEWIGTTGGVNWSSGRISAEGIGLPPENVRSIAQAKALACRAAVVDAQRNLLEVTKGVRVEATTLVANFMVTSGKLLFPGSFAVRGPGAKGQKWMDRAR